MATVLRGPLFAGNHKRPDAPSFWTVPNLLTSTLIVAAGIPFNNASAFTAPQIRPAIYADTSKGVPKTLTQDALSAFVVSPSFAPVLPGNSAFLNADTSRGTAKTLYADSTSPFFNAPQSALSRPRLGLETSRFLIPTGPAPVPFANLPHQPFQASPWKAADTSASTPKPLYADAVTPAFNPAQIQVDRLRPVVDTSRGTPAPMQAIVPPAPFVNPVLRPSPVPLWKSADTSAGIPKPLFADSVAPFVNPAQPQVDKARRALDTSQSTPIVLGSVQAPPFVNPVLRSSPVPLWKVSDTSQSTPIVLGSVQIPPFANPVHVRPSPVLLWRTLDTSAGIPKTLFADAVAPFVNPAQPQVDKARRALDTSQSTPIVLGSVQAPLVNSAHLRSSPVPLWRYTDTSQSTATALLLPAVVGSAPFVNLPIVSPDRGGRGWQDTSQSTPKTLYANPVVPKTSTGNGDGDEKKKKKKRKHDENEYELKTVFAPLPRVKLVLPGEVAEVAEVAEVVEVVKADSALPEPVIEQWDEDEDEIFLLMNA